jgi:D-arabinose 1-dehydrogenase-like Zn-dependent alcohol dehydrogenase
MAATMKALRKMNAGRGLSFESAPVPAIGATDVLVRVKTASICWMGPMVAGKDQAAGNFGA